MKCILVTGGSGYIGSHTCLSLLNKGYYIFVIDSNINSSIKSLERILEIGKSEGKSFSKQIYFLKGDIRDQLFIEKVFEKAIKLNKKIDAVIHFAGLKSVGNSVKEPLLYWENNVYGSINLFNSMKKYKCKTIVFSSSATIYGVNNGKPLCEDNPRNPINPYGDTKLAIENILRNIYSSSDTNWRIANLRYFNPIGAHHSGLIGEDLINTPNNIFPILCDVAYGNRDRILVFGKDWPTYDGTCIRDYIHVMDLAEAHTRSLDFLFKGPPVIIDLNIGTGNGTSVLELINTFEKVNSCKINYQFTGRREGDSAAVVADNGLAKKLLNWEPKRNLNHMCSDGWKWINLNPKGYEGDSNSYSENYLFNLSID